MLIAIHGVKLNAHCNTCSEALCSLLYMESCSRLNAIQGLKLYAHCYTWSKALCSMLIKERSIMLFANME